VIAAEPDYHALGLYESLGFRDTSPYNDNPIAGTRHMVLGISP